jgi:ribulose-5-phosphate 4-epimerase/fuculose-1-phosphate aldolase
MTIKKKELVNLFYILDKMNIGDLTANHASIYSKEKKGFYINKHQYLFSQVKTKNLAFVKSKDQFTKKNEEINKAGFFIHQYLHLSKAKPNAILHTHSINSVAISSIKNGFNEKLNQSSMRFFKRIKYFNYNGMVMDKNEGLKLQKLVDKDTKLIILKNHGIIIMANTIDELFHLTFHFEKCAEVQLKIDSKIPLVKVTDKIAKLTCRQHEGFGKVGKMSWAAMKKNFKLN